MKKFLKIYLALVATAFTASALANPIVVVIDQGENNGNATADGTMLGGYLMTGFDDPIAPTSGCSGTGYGPNEYGVTSTASPISGDVEFVMHDGVTPLCMSVYDPSTQIGGDWWQWTDHGNIFTTATNWVELIMPTGTRAFSTYVGAHGGRGWIEGEDGSGNRTRVAFGGDSGVDFGWGDTPGFGVYSPDSCSSITRVVIEPWEWGTGSFAINQDPCTQVPEPGSLWLFGIGLLGLGLSSKWSKRTSAAEHS